MIVKKCTQLISYLDKRGLFSHASSIYKLVSFASIEDYRIKIDEAARGRQDPFSSWFNGSDRVYLSYGDEQNSAGDKEAALRQKFPDVSEWIDKYTSESSADANLLAGRLGSGRKIGGKFFLQITKKRLNEFYNENHHQIAVDKNFFIKTIMTLFGVNFDSNSYGASPKLISLVNDNDIYSGNDFEKMSFLDSLSGIIGDSNYHMQEYINSSIRGNKDVANFNIVITKNPTDVAAMSTDRRWTSCMALPGGQHSGDVFCDIRVGAFVAYLIDERDKNVEKPLARIRARRFDNLSGDSFAMLEDEIYSDGTDYPGFKEAVQQWIDGHQGNLEYGTYYLQGGSWSDTFDKTYDVGKEWPNDPRGLSDMLAYPDEALDAKTETYIVTDELFENHEEYFPDDDDAEYGEDYWGYNQKLSMYHLPEGGRSFASKEDAYNWINQHNQYWQDELLTFIEHNNDLSYDIDTSYPEEDYSEDEKALSDASPWEGMSLTDAGMDLLQYVNDPTMRFKIEVNTAEEKQAKEISELQQRLFQSLKSAHRNGSLRYDNINLKGLNSLIDSERKKWTDLKESMLKQRNINYGGTFSRTLKELIIMFPNLFTKEEVKKAISEEREKQDLEDFARDYSSMQDEEIKEDMRRQILDMVFDKLEYASLRRGYEVEGYYYGIDRSHSYGSHPYNIDYKKRLSNNVIKTLHSEAPLTNSFSDKLISLYQNTYHDASFVADEKLELKESSKQMLRRDLINMLGAMNAHNPRTIYFYRDLLSKFNEQQPIGPEWISGYKDSEFYYILINLLSAGLSAEPLIPELELIFSRFVETEKTMRSIYRDDYRFKILQKNIHEIKRLIVQVVHAIRRGYQGSE